MFGDRWNFPGVGLVRLAVPDDSVLARIDESWPAMRSASSESQWWSWRKIMDSARDRFVLRDTDGGPLALWSSVKSSPLRLPGGRFYRLDYLEVSPRSRKVRLGAFMMTLVARRAAEIGAGGVVFGALPEAAPFYETIGFQEGSVAGWRAERGLLPYHLEGEALERLIELGNAFLEEDAAEE